MTTTPVNPAPTTPSVGPPNPFLIKIRDLIYQVAGIFQPISELRQVNFQEEPAFGVPLEECTTLATFDRARFTFELEGYLEEVRSLVRQFYGTAYEARRQTPPTSPRFCAPIT